MTVWGEVLASFAACLQRHRQVFDVLSTDSLEPHASPIVFVPPQGLPPLPEELRPRAELLMLEARALERAEVTRLNELRKRSGSQIPRQGRPALLDQRG